MMNPQALRRACHRGLGMALVATSALGAAWNGQRPARPDFDVNAKREQVLGPFRLQPAVTLYLISDGAPARGRVIIQQGPYGSRNNRVMLRVFDDAERLVHWQYTQSDLDEIISHPQDPYVAGLPALPLEPDAQGGKTLIDGQFAVVGRGVHQIRAGADQFNAPLAVALSRKMEWGVSFQNGDWTEWPGAPSAFWVYVPPRASELNLTLRNGAIRVLDERGLPLWTAATDSRTRTVEKKLEISRTGAVWRVEFPKRTFFLKVHGFPFILCSSEAAARTIKASVEVLPDGTVVCHKFQRRILEVLPQILAPANVGKAADLIVPLKAREAEWLAHPLRNAILCGYSPFIRGVAHALRQQNVAPTHRWSALFSHYDPPKGTAARHYRWDTFLPVPGIGDSRDVETGAYGLAKAATLDVPLNPYYGKRELLYRAAAASLRDLMVLNEAEVWPGAAAHWYPSSMSFVMGNKNLPPFGLAAALMPASIREIWAEGVRRMFDRAYTNNLVSARNQCSHCLVVNEYFAMGTQDPVYTRLSRLYAAHFAAGADPAGWHMEACGPCGSYIGMSHWHMALYYRLSRDDAFLPCIAKSYRFFNQTVAPEPDGRTMLGGFNFNHRVGMGFFMEQYGGATGILDDVLPEVGIWAGPAPTEEELAESRKQAIERIEKELNRPRDVFPGRLTDPRFEYYSPDKKRGVWPALEPGPFIRNVENQLICVKRAAYYVTLYLAKPAGLFYIRGREKFRLPLPDEGESRGAEGKPKPITPYLGGGLSMFWTPEYGVALMATNWSPLCHHGLVATRMDGKRYWEDYHAAEFRLDEAAGELTIIGKVESLPLRYERRYSFEESGVSVALALVAEDDVKLARLIENLPLVAGRLKVRGAKIAEPTGQDAETDRIGVTNNVGAGVDFALDHARPVHVCRNGMVSHYRLYKINRAEVVLQASFKKGERAGLSYRIQPIAR